MSRLQPAGLLHSARRRPTPPRAARPDRDEFFGRREGHRRKNEPTVDRSIASVRTLLGRLREGES